MFRFFTQSDVEVQANYMERYARVFRPTEIKIEARGSALHFVRSGGPSPVDETLHHVGDDVFGFRYSLLFFRREGGKITGVRLDSVGGNVLLTRQN